MREVMPLIEKKIADGVRIADILVALADTGLELSEATLKSYLYRYRKRKKPEQASGSSPALPVETSITAVDTDAEPASGESEPVSISDLDRLMKPDPAKEAKDLAHYERLGRDQRRKSK